MFESYVKISRYCTNDSDEVLTSEFESYVKISRYCTDIVKKSEELIV